MMGIDPPEEPDWVFPNPDDYLTDSTEEIENPDELIKEILPVNPIEEPVNPDDPTEEVDGEIDEIDKIGGNDEIEDTDEIKDSDADDKSNDKSDDKVNDKSDDKLDEGTLRRQKMMDQMKKRIMNRAITLGRRKMTRRMRPEIRTSKTVGMEMTMRPARMPMTAIRI
ncbi:MAG: hypothetical protein V8S58_02550 [Lachnospiraceae bacterium]